MKSMKWFVIRTDLKHYRNSDNSEELKYSINTVISGNPGKVEFDMVRGCISKELKRWVKPSMNMVCMRKLEEDF